ncbi:TerB family tellurite resistance protein [Chitinophaga sedimenti]|uniref:tellurite resistance TerB family protein n=1 Tax=Chitinophaga sedimenti TaxID=2033606 RepID=UPI0020047F4A|nr:TerB family tellurite resistance protein [Chitinophaga sedimenti]MCK7559793.1 TerB family tellurite resistance protein [Chitinophaga sedimenti]
MALTPELKNHFLHFYQMALSDSEIDVKELEALYLIGQDRGISREEIDNLLLQSGSVDILPPQSVLEKIDCLYDLSLIAWSDGQLDPEERETLERFCARFGFEDQNVGPICDYLLEEAFKKHLKKQSC